MKNLIQTLILSLGCLFLFAGYSIAQESEWVNFTNGEEVQCIAIEDNYIWVGTTGGLVRINKSKQEIVFYNKANSGLPSNNVTSIVIDAIGNKWIGTTSIDNIIYDISDDNIGGGLAKFNGDKSWTVYNTFNSKITENNITTLAVDSKNNIWIGTLNSGLIKFDGDADWVIYNSSNSVILNNGIEYMTIDKYDFIWIGTLDKDNYISNLTVYDGINFTVIKNADGNDIHASTIIIDQAGNKWIGNDALHKFDDTNWYEYTIPTPCSQYGNRINSIAIDQEGNKWVGSQCGLLKFNGTSWTNYIDSSSTWSYPNVSAVAIDPQGNKWLGTQGGIARFDGSSWINYKTSNSGLPYNNSDFIAIDSHRNKWITSGQRLVKFDDNYWEVYTTPKPDNTFLQTLAIDLQDNVWLCAFNGHEIVGSLMKFDGIYWLSYSTYNSGLPSINVESIAIDKSGEIWFGCGSEHYPVDGGIAKFDGTNWTGFTPPNIELEHYSVSALAIDSEGNKWLGTYDNGLVKFDGQNWTIYDTHNSGLPDSSITQVAIDSKGNKWIGTVRGGIVKFDGKNWIVFNKENSAISENAISAIAIDSQDNVWVGFLQPREYKIPCKGGLAKYNSDKSEWTIFNVYNSGLASSVISSIAIDSNNNKWIGSNNCLTVYNETGVILSLENKQLKTYNDFKIYPNPAKDIIYINHTSSASVNIFNLTGQQVMETKLKTEKSIDISSLNPGVYLLQAIEGEKIYNSKIIVR